MLILQGNLGFHDNIGVFGGDPGNSVAMGQRVGAFNSFARYLVSRDTRGAHPESSERSIYFRAKIRD